MKTKFKWFVVGYITASWIFGFSYNVAVKLGLIHVTTPWDAELAQAKLYDMQRYREQNTPEEDQDIFMPS